MGTNELSINRGSTSALAASSYSASRSEPAPASLPSSPGGLNWSTIDDCAEPPSSKHALAAGSTFAWHNDQDSGGESLADDDWPRARRTSSVSAASVPERKKKK